MRVLTLQPQSAQQFPLYQEESEKSHVCAGDLCVMLKDAISPHARRRQRAHHGGYDEKHVAQTC